MRAKYRWLVWGTVALALSVGAAVVLLVNYGAADQSAFTDIDVYVAGANAALHGTSVYRDFLVGELYFTYPPTAAIMFIPFTVVPTGVLHWSWTVAIMGCLFGSLWVVLGMLGHRRGLQRLGMAALATALLMWTQPANSNLVFGQINTLLMLVVLADLAQREGGRFKGVGIGLAAAVKLVPGIFILYFIYTRRWRAALVSASTFLLATAASFLVLPRDFADYWFGQAFLRTHRIGWVESVGNESVNGALLRLHLTNPWLRNALVVLVVVLGLELASLAHKRGQEAVAILVVACTGVMASPIAWAHHWVWVCPALLVLAHLAWQQRGKMRLALGGLALLTYLVAFNWPIPLVNELAAKGPFGVWGYWGLVGLADFLKYRPLQFTTVVEVLASTYLLASIFLFGLAWYWLRHPSAAATRAAPDRLAAPRRVEARLEG